MPSGTTTLTWLGDVVLRINTLGSELVMVPKQTFTITNANESATASALLMNLAALGLFEEIDPKQVPSTLGATPIQTAIAATSPEPFTTTPPEEPYVHQGE